MKPELTGEMSGPLVLALETACSDAAVALADSDGLIAHGAVCRGRRHVETLHLEIAALCSGTGVELAALGAVAVDIGPGLFTGLRVGVTAAKALGAALGIPLVPVTSLEILSASMEESGLIAPGTRVVPVVDMRRGEVAWMSDGAYRVGPPGQLAEEVALLAAGPDQATGGRELEVVLGGDGAVRYAEEILARCAGGERSRARVAGVPYSSPSAAVLALIAVGRFLAGDVAAADDVLPMYLRDADAAIGWESRHGRVPAIPAAGRA
jgi:tRNA threonylcarbamoyladenosine biosynthesis protein TsaB